MRFAVTDRSALRSEHASGGTLKVYYTLLKVVNVVIEVDIETGLLTLEMSMSLKRCAIKNQAQVIIHLFTRLAQPSFYGASWPLMEFLHRHPRPLLLLEHHQSSASLRMPGPYQPRSRYL